MKWSVYFYIAVILVSFVIIAGSIYQYLGGFEEVNVYELGGESRVVIGKHFQGKANHTDIGSYFREAQALILDSAVRGTLVRVYNPNDTLDKNEVNFFIGIMIDNEMAEVPSGFEVREYYPKKRFAVFLKMNKWVRPSSRTIDAMLTEKAVSLGFSPPSRIVEVYYMDDSMSVEAWI